MNLRIPYYWTKNQDFKHWSDSSWGRALFPPWKISRTSWRTEVVVGGGGGLGASGRLAPDGRNPIPNHLTCINKPCKLMGYGIYINWWKPDFWPINRMLVCQRVEILKSSLQILVMCYTRAPGVSETMTFGQFKRNDPWRRWCLRIGWIFVFTSCPIYFVSHAHLNQCVTTRPQENCCDVKWRDVVKELMCE